MEKRYTGEGLDFLDFQNSQIGLPAVIPEQRVIVRTQVVRKTPIRDSVVEQATKDYTIDITRMQTEAYYASRELIHDYEQPVALQVNRFTPKQIDAPEAVGHVSQKGQP